MMLHRITEPPAEELGRALECFEAQFSYPLGKAGHFRISHGRRYLPFFQAMGKAVLLAVEIQGWIVGTLVVVERTLLLGGNLPEQHRAHYLCDLKVSPGARGGRVLAKLLAAAKEVILASGAHSCYCIVMDGTERLPVEYTGRLGIPCFEKLGGIQVLRISRGVPGREATRPDGNIRRDTGATACVVTGGDSALRSAMAPYLIHQAEGAAFGTVEDTRKSKQLWMLSGAELGSAHLSGFSFTDPDAGADVIREALAHAGKRLLPALFVAVPARQAAVLKNFLTDLCVQVSPATIFGHGIPFGFDWWVDTAEI